MIGLVIVTHGRIGHEMLNTLSGIVGPQTQIKAIAIASDGNAENGRDTILSAVKEVNSGKGVLILTDMFGGTPSNLAIAAMPLTQAIVLAGLNLPMLIKLASVRGQMNLLDAAREAETAGRKYIQLIAEDLTITKNAS